MRALYTVLLYVITPLILLRLLWRGLALRDYWQRWGERFGHVRATEPVAVWVHAVSVGEALAAAPMVRELVTTHGERRVLVTTTTPTGSARVRDALGDTVQHVYAPYDLPHVVSRFLARMQPQRVVVMETELWPNLFAALGRRGVPLFIVNARLSPGSFRGYQRVRGFARATLAHCRKVLAQSAADAERFAALGAPRVEATGNIKFDLHIGDGAVRQGERLRRRLGENRFVWAAVSTHDGEEAAAVAAHRELLQARADAALILVPRHPQRFDEAARTVTGGGLSVLRRSAVDDAEDAPLHADVLIGDSMGEMFMYLAAADAVFVGGSLVPVGGHNVLEPAALARPVLFGPQMHNFVEARELLLGAEAAIEVESSDKLAAAVTELAADPTRRQRLGEAGRAAVNANRGALARVLQRIAE